MIPAYLNPTCLAEDVAKAVREDVGSGDITAQLIPAEKMATAKVFAREAAIICGRPWVDEVFRQIAPEAKIVWQVNEGSRAAPETVIFSVSGQARQLLTAERTALNFLQALSGIATTARHYAELVNHTDCIILDTRKTLPGMRLAQKYAVRAGGCQNHRIGLWDAYLIKENHISACGSIGFAVSKAKKLHPGKSVEVEVETIEQLTQALNARADVIMLDNFDVGTMREAVRIAAGRSKLEASGGIDDSTIVDIAETGVDFISIGAMTKHCKAIDLSMRFSD